MKNSKITLLAAAALTAASFTIARAEILIATAGPLTGQAAGFGEQQRQGAERAVADLNAKGGVLGETVQLMVVDDACDPEQAVAVANQLVSAGVALVNGHICSGSSIPASKVYEEAGILMISSASTNPRLTDEGGSNVFRVVGRDDQQGAIAGNYLADEWADKQIAILHDGQDYGKGLADETRKQLNKRGVKEVMYEAYVAGEKDYSPLISRMQEAGVDVMYVGGYVTEAGLILRQSHDQGYDIRLVSGDAMASDEFWLIAGPVGNDTVMTFPPDPRNNPDAAPVVAKFRAINYEPEGYTLHSYAVVQAWGQAVEKAGSRDADKVSRALRSHQFDTVLGRIGFDKKGDITTPGFVWYIWKDGEYGVKE